MQRLLPTIASLDHTQAAAPRSPTPAANTSSKRAPQPAQLALVKCSCRLMFSKKDAHAEHGWQLWQGCSAYPIRQSLLVGLGHAVECLAKLILLVSGRVEVTRPAPDTSLRIHLDTEQVSDVACNAPCSSSIKPQNLECSVLSTGYQACMNISATVMSQL